jgi:hypothetical protein
MGRSALPSVPPHRAHRIAHADLPPIHLHGLRHGTVTMALATGIDFQTISRILGHASVAFTMQTYGALPDELQHKAAQRIADLINHECDQAARIHSRRRSLSPGSKTSSRSDHRHARRLVHPPNWGWRTGPHFIRLELKPAPTWPEKPAPPAKRTSPWRPKISAGRHVDVSPSRQNVVYAIRRNQAWAAHGQPTGGI